MPSLVVQAPPLPFPSSAGGGGVERGSDERRRKPIRILPHSLSLSLSLSLSSLFLSSIDILEYHLLKSEHTFFSSYLKDLLLSVAHRTKNSPNSLTLDVHQTNQTFERYISYFFLGDMHM